MTPTTPQEVRCRECEFYHKSGPRVRRTHHVERLIEERCNNQLSPVNGSHPFPSFWCGCGRVKPSK